MIDDAVVEILLQRKVRDVRLQIRHLVAEELFLSEAMAQ
jgi:hypothetical protein